MRVCALVGLPWSEISEISGVQLLYLFVMTFCIKWVGRMQNVMTNPESCFNISLISLISLIPPKQWKKWYKHSKSVRIYCVFGVRPVVGGGIISLIISLLEGIISLFHTFLRKMKRHVTFWKQRFSTLIPLYLTFYAGWVYKIPSKMGVNTKMTKIMSNEKYEHCHFLFWV